MSIEVYSAKRNRVYRRKFDHEEAKARVAAGETIAALARKYGVNYNAVWQAVTPGAKEAGLDYARRWRTTTCEACGGPAMKLTGSKKAHPDGRVLCNRCRADARCERLRFDESGQLAAVRCAMLDCANGERWQPPENFTRGHRHREVREGGIHDQCRACQTRARHDYRRRHRETENAYARAYKQRRRSIRHG